jgi:dynein heavy chain, axonemal
LTLEEFLFSPIQLKELELLRLPHTHNILENGCFLMEDKSYNDWLLICDSSRRSIDWLRTLHKGKTFHILKQYDMKSILETCLSEGYYLLLTDCDVKSLMNNRRLEMIIRNKIRFITSEKPFKLSIDNQEIECNPNFRLFLHTTSNAHEIPSDIAAYSVVLNYNLTPQDIEEELLDRFLFLAKPRIDTERFSLLQEKLNILKVIDPLEQNITNFLASDVSLLKSFEPTKKLSDLKKSYDEALDSNLRIENAEEPLLKTRESYRDIAARASICYKVISSLKEINSNYVLSYDKFVELFDASLFQFERSSTPQIIKKLTQTVYSSVSRSLNEHDARVFIILFCFEIELADNRLHVGEREFIVSPSFGASFVQNLTGKVTQEHKFWATKKPFDWMTDECFVNLQYLAISHQWFYDPFDRMSRDGREMQWRSLCEAEIPELVALPDKLDDILTPIQRLCIIRAGNSSLYLIKFF